MAWSRAGYPALFSFSNFPFSFEFLAIYGHTPLYAHTQDVILYLYKVFMTGQVVVA